MHKSLLVGAALVALAASSVFAADMPLKAPPKMPVVFDWTGFYIGANIGWSFGHQSTGWTIANLPAGTATASMNGILGGLQFGYNWQTGGGVVGFESDIQATGQNGTSSLANAITTFTTTTTNPCFPVANCPTTVTTATTTNAIAASEAKLQWFGTIRARLGVTPWQRGLLFVTGGVAYGEVQSNETLVFGGAGAAAGANVIHSGWTVGGGIETALTDNWSAKIEYLYIDLGHINLGFTGVGVLTPIASDLHVTDNIVRGGINYRFGGPPAVAAKY